MVTFKELTKGEIAGVPIPSRENPFYHARVSGSKDWSNSRKSVFLNDGIPFVRTEGQIELIIRQGHWVDIEVKSKNFNHYSQVDADSDSRILNQFETGAYGDSVIQFRIYGGGALAVSSESLNVSESFETEFNLGNTSWFQLESGEIGEGVAGGWGGKGTYVYLAPHPPLFIAGEMTESPEQARSISWGDGDAGVRITLLDYGLTIDDSGETYESAANDATANDSDNASGTAEGSRYRTDDWDIVRIGDETDPEGWFYTVTRGYESGDQIWRAYINGVQMEGDFYNEQDATTRANHWLTFYTQNNLPAYLQREQHQGTDPPEEQLIPDWVKWAVLIAGGALGAYFIFKFVQTLATGTAGRVTDSL